MHILPLHISDFFQATARFTPDQTGIYLLLLLEYYKNEKPLADEVQDLEFLCGISGEKQKAALRFILKRCFVHDATAKVFRQKRADLEIIKYRESCVQNRYAILCRHWDKVNKGHDKPGFEAFKANPARYYDDATRSVRAVTGRKVLVLEPDISGNTDAALPGYVPVSSIHVPVTSTTPIVPQGGPSTEDLAEAIYALYPKKVGKPPALKAIVKVLKAGKITELELQAKTKSFADAVRQWPEQDKPFIPNPATWFNQERFMDDPATWRRESVAPSTGGFGQKKEKVAAAGPKAVGVEPEWDWRGLARELGWRLPEDQRWELLEGSQRFDLRQAWENKKIEGAARPNNE